jgi:hypothetical protein
MQEVSKTIRMGLWSYQLTTLEVGVGVYVGGGGGGESVDSVQ